MSSHLLDCLVNQMTPDVFSHHKFQHQRPRRKRRRRDEMQYTTESDVRTVTVIGAQLPKCSSHLSVRESSTGTGSYLSVSPDTFSYVTPQFLQHLNRKRRHFSSSSQSAGSDANSDQAGVYAGARFANSPPPDCLPLPPLHWVMDLSFASGSRRQCRDIAKVIKSLLQISDLS